MKNLLLLRSLCRATAAAANSRRTFASRALLSVSAPPKIKTLPSSDYQSSLAMGIGCTRSFSEDVTHMPVIKDSEIHRVFKDLLAVDWNELPNDVIQNAKQALSKNTDDKDGQEVLKNVFSAAEAVEEFSGMITQIKMEIDDSIGMSGENVKPLSDELSKALSTAFQRYMTYLDAFGPDESYLRKKVEMELGSKMIYLKMRCSGLGPEWGKVSVLGTSGLSGSYIEQRA
ncbi:hypothetical protein ACOSP7_012522 [Xanthoceras sorbifolium]|uniref:Succinate dehydrogenase subunit 5, mitochondrial n=1 Tax=Xanthoceras sorbifolium TaxID=99658 RepID=A0ABQ8HXW9_9ROSI|nr:hypothetical protein JRO89_XS06G0125700 [Xanthoceras sorbifolium]